MTPLNLVRVLFMLAATVLGGLIVWASLQASIGTSFLRMIDDPWGVVTLTDLSLGFLAAATVIWLAEGRRALVWIAALFVLGNVVTAVWLARRLPDLAPALRRLRAGG